MWNSGLLPETPFGPLRVTASETGIVFVDFSSYLPAEAADAASPLVERALQQLSEYLARQRQSFDLPIDWRDLPAFQQDVLRVAQSIPYGHTLTYGQIAARLGQSPAASRAVGAALAHNPIPIIIPCHRVLAAGGKLHGFSAPGGIHTKAELLRLEGYPVVYQKYSLF